MRLRLLRGVVGAWSVLCLPATAQTPAHPNIAKSNPGKAAAGEPELSRVISPAGATLASADHVEAVQAMAGAAFRLSTGCTGRASLTPAGPPAPLPPTSFSGIDSAGVLRVGAIVESFNIEACGQTLRENVVTAIGKDGVRVTAIEPGTTRGDPRLVHDAIPKAREWIAAHRATKCATIVPYQLEFDKYDEQTDDTKPRGWTETWRFRACDAIVGVTARFVPKPTGMTIEFADPPPG